VQGLKPVFPNKFDLASLSGCRATSFSKREDAFQQLVGEALQLAVGVRAHVASTKGRDGSIDVWVERIHGTSSPFTRLPGPIIVECKDHDDSLSNFISNVFSGWRKVEQKLKGEAKKGWSGLFAPWRRARSYAYVVSAVLHQAARDELTEVISKFFDEIPIEHRPPIETVRVLDWNDLRPWLSSMVRLSDSWLGTGSAAILTHGEYINSLKGFREFLLSSRLPYVIPGASQQGTSPDALFHILNKGSNRPGVLLVGVGGVGKTRTSIEVASLAESQGWRALHVMPESNVTNEDLAGVVLSGSQPSLLVFDYVDQIQWLDFGLLRRSLLPQAQQRGIQVKLLANCRPGWLRLSSADIDELFERTDLLPEIEYRERIIHEIVIRTAPRSLEHLGKAELIRLCGNRPIIALLIARELEKRFASGRSEKPEIAGLRTGDLLRWLRRRLADDGIKVEVPTSALEPSRPAVAVVAAAAVLACTPNKRETMIIAGERAAKKLHEPCNAEYIVAALESLGWLEQSGSQLVAAHDVIVDEIFDQIVREGTFVRVAELEAVLSIWSISTEMIGRLATSLKRVIGAIDDNLAANNVKDATAHWLERNASSVGKYLASQNVEVTSFSLGAVIDNPLWSGVVSKTWDNLVAPWLAAHGQNVKAFRLLYKGLRTEENTEKLIGASLKWLHKFSDNFAAQFVLGPLLNQQELGDKAPESIQLAISWLEKFSQKLGAQFVLAPLLRRDDLGHQSTKIIRLALIWLNKFPRKLEAQFVLATLLRWDYLADKAAEVRTLSLSWLKNYRKKIDASFVLLPLLERNDLGNNSDEVFQFTMSWLKKFRYKLESNYVLGAILKREDLGDKAGEVHELALSWLRKFRDKLEAGFVLGAFLRREDLGDKAGKVYELALSWLEQFLDKFQARFILGPLLMKKDALNGRDVKTVEIALTWLHTFPDKLGTYYMLGRLLGRKDLGNKTPDAIDLTLLWLRKFAHKSQAGYVLEGLLGQEDLGDKAGEIYELALSWLKKFFDTPGATHVLGPLLSWKDLGERKNEVIELALVWLEKYPDNLDAGFVLTPLLEQHGIGDNANKVINRALTWMGGRRKSDYVFNRILRSPNASVEQWAQAAQAGLLLLRSAMPKNLDRDHTINSLLTRYEFLRSEDLEFVLLEATDWLQKNPVHSQANRLRINLRRVKRSLASDNPLHEKLENVDTYGKFVSALETKVKDGSTFSDEQEFRSSLLQIEHEAIVSTHSAGFAIPSILVLGCRFGDDALSEVVRVTRSIIDYKRRTKLHLEKLSMLCWGLLHQGAFPDRTQAIRVLNELGLLEPTGDPNTFGRSLLSNPRNSSSLIE
jgi:hypothetical protein